MESYPFDSCNQRQQHMTAYCHMLQTMQASVVHCIEAHPSQKADSHRQAKAALLLERWCAAGMCYHALHMT